MKLLPTIVLFGLVTLVGCNKEDPHYTPDEVHRAEELCKPIY